MQTVICVIFLAACGAVTPYPLPTPLVTATPTFITIPTRKPHPTRTPTRGPYIAPTNETLYGYPTPEQIMFPTCDPLGGCILNLTPNAQRQDFTFHELYVGKYVLRRSCNVDSQSILLSSICAVTISSNGTKQIEIWAYPARLGEETGADLTGRGKPNIVIIDASGGNCCTGIIVYETGDSLKKIAEIGSYRVGTFTDLNGDNTYEYIAPYRNFSYFCSNCTLWTSVVYEYQPGLEQYMPATYKFKEVLSDQIEWTSDAVAQFTKQNPTTPFLFESRNSNDSDTDSKEFWKLANENPDYYRATNALYQLVAYYLLIGRPTDAQNTLNKYFPPDKATEYMEAIQKDLGKLLAP